MEEKVFFSHNGVSVSNARFIVHGQTYAMNGVTSVKQAVKEPSRLGPVILGVIGLIALLNGGNGIIFGVALLAATVLWWMRQKPEWIVVLNSSSGETQALTSEDRSYISGVIEALNQSIIHRG
jgi:hypothetical protein